MEYELNIDGIQIAKNSKIVKYVDIKISQTDKSASERSDLLFADLTIRGRLFDGSKKETKAMFDWSQKTDKGSVYKNVQIKVFDGEELIRDYTLEQMFCASYQESFDEPDSGLPISNGKGSVGSFVLEMKQKAGYIDRVTVAID